MKKKIIWLIVSCLMVAALILTSCGPAVVEEKVEEVVVEKPVGEPQYGGTLTAIYSLKDSARSPDTAYGLGYTFNNPVLSKLFTSDVYTYGNKPGGTGEWDYLCMEVPFKYQTGDLAESWEISPDKMVFHIRPDVYWSGLSINPVMEKREYTAHDYVADLLRRLSPDATTAGYFKGIDWVKEPYTEHVYAEDRYTVVIETNYYHAAWFFILTGGAGQQMAPETVVAGPDKWENVVGTGPFYVKEYVPGSHLTYGKNPYYYRKALINGVEYATPFIDELVLPLIADETTAIAALRTGMADVMYRVRAPHVPSLAETNPELGVKLQTIGSFVPAFYFRCDQPPFSDKEVRRALFIGTDREAVHAMLMTPGEWHGWPIMEGWEGHVPFERLPESCQELYSYDPTKAKQMLADAGYPDGFEMDMLVADRDRMPDIAELLADQWSKYGITIRISVPDYTITKKRAGGLDFKDCVAISAGLSMPAMFTTQYYSTEGPRNYAVYHDEYSNSRLMAAIREADKARRAKLLEEAFVHILDDAVTISFKRPAEGNYWWPWVKNCYGEAYGSCNQGPDYHNYWIDTELKAEMGY